LWPREQPSDLKELTLNDIYKADLRFGRFVIVGMVVIFATALYFTLALLSAWSLIPLWLCFGAVSVVVQVNTDFGYIRLAPRFDALISFTMSLVAGPISLARTLWDLRDKADPLID
jgi:hypothetical protein